ncbi:hypothetical protein BDP81DRAFT_166019 [Colletotrichum phormii]|uniref:Uncharacterized protein n=1 Tax=Colletotrichum phormii TaxID=359342 RepID=A0AAI9ZYJ1_9PEZI|nr:uncharacterized protein BDP81DRAFT_166019 [Colletotrichum phormii]KAK1640610.1 hypothetical protein BDP81DRAFT_166019 [Colletotrichum phormii]
MKADARPRPALLFHFFLATCWKGPSGLFRPLLDFLDPLPNALCLEPTTFSSHFSYTSIQSTAFKRKGKKKLNPAWTSTALLIISRLTPRHPDRSTPPPPPHSPHAVGWSSSELLGTPAHRHTPAELLLLPKIILFLARRLVFATHFLPIHLPTTVEQ